MNNPRSTHLSMWINKTSYSNYGNHNIKKKIMQKTYIYILSRNFKIKHACYIRISLEIGDKLRMPLISKKEAIIIEKILKRTFYRNSSLVKIKIMIEL